MRREGRRRKKGRFWKIDGDSVISLLRLCRSSRKN